VGVERGRKQELCRMKSPVQKGWWLAPVILATQEAEIRKTMV
jgi:hypothetical protein